MPFNDDDTFDVYVRTLGKVRSGAKLQEKDYGTLTLSGFVPYTSEQKLAVTLAVQDSSFKAPTRSKQEVIDWIKERTGPVLSRAATVLAAAPSTMPSRSSEMIGDWQVIRPLARGGQGDVLLVERRTAKEHAIGVLKRVPAKFADDQKRLDRLRHEIETIRELKHPFIAELLDFRLNELWFVTRHAPLGSLADHLSWFKGDSWRTLRMARDIATALGVAHSKGVIHRDVKPGNILLHDPNHVALTDFGIAHDTDQTEVTSTHERVGAQWFRPPEAEHGRHEPTPSFDVYMLGKVIYVALTGGARFLRERFSDGDTDVEKMFGRREFSIFNNLFARMIVEDRAGRFQSMEDVIGSIDSGLMNIYGRKVAPDSCTRCETGRYSDHGKLSWTSAILWVGADVSSGNLEKHQPHLFVCDSCGDVNMRFMNRPPVVG